MKETPPDSTVNPEIADRSEGFPPVFSEFFRFSFSHFLFLFLFDFFVFFFHFFLAGLFFHT